ncbi:MAG: hypothetical protein Q8P59_01465, partial [Dehalococcoidia bacterium]|nr:hypothetical protein [Dehalococcoidia bacterium]
PQGISGFSGTSGASGQSGQSGLSGFSGYSSPSGVSGASGSSGLSGFSGIHQGESGTSGSSGGSGFSGFSGGGTDGALAWSAQGGVWSSASGVNRSIPFGGVKFDTNSLWDNGDPTKLTAPSDGVYIIVAGLQWPDHPTSGARKSMVIRLNDTTEIAKALSHPNSNNLNGITCSTIYALEAGDYVELQAFHQVVAGEHAGNVGGAGGTTPFLAMYRIGPGA